MKAGRLKNYIAVVEVDGATYHYVTFGRRRGEAEREARESAGASGATLVRIEPAIDSRTAARRRQLFAAAITAAVTTATITGVLIVWISLGVL